MNREIIDAISANRVPDWGNKGEFIGVHYLGVVGQNHDLASDGAGAHFYIYWDGTIYQRCSLDAVPWAVGTAGYYTQKHPKANNYNTISVEMCCKCDSNAQSAEDPKWYFTKETQEACVWLVQKLMKENNIPAENVLRHYDIVNKICPAPYVHNNRYRGTWTWEEFKARVSGKEIEPEKWYRVRKNWNDASTQLGAYLILENARANCPVGYSVYDKTGKALYTNEIPAGVATDNIWMGWTKRETGKDGLRNIHGDNGKAYGLQFDYRYGLVPFLQFCMDFDPDKYAAFKKFIDLGAGNSALIYNKELGRLWQQFYDANPGEFEQLQYLCAYQKYYLPAKEYVLKHYGFDMADKAPAVKGTLWSMAFRSGSETAAKKFAGCKGMADLQILNHVYPTYGSADAGRWTKAGQWGDALHALETGEYTTLALHMADKSQEPQIGNNLLDALADMQEQLQSDIAADRKWIYSNVGCSVKMSTALKKGNRKCNCALLVRWALRKLGLLNGDNWWGEKGGTIIWRGNSKQQMLKHFDLIHVAGKKTVNQAIKDGTMQAGDIVTYVKMQHTNVYAGNGKWYDAGHAYASGSGEGAVFKSWYGDMVHGAQPIGYILRRKDTEKPEQKLHIVREGLYNKKTNADRQCKAIRRAGIDCIVKLVNGKYWTQCGAFEELENAEARVRQLRAVGFDGMIK